MEKVAKKLKDTIGGLTDTLIVAMGIFLVVQIVFRSRGENGEVDIMGNITGVFDSFIGTGGSLASHVALLIVMAVLDKKAKLNLQLQKLNDFKNQLHPIDFYFYIAILD